MSKIDSLKQTGWGGLRETSLKLRAIGYLFQNLKEDSVPPLDLEDAMEGVGHLLTCLAIETQTVWRELDELSARSHPSVLKLIGMPIRVIDTPISSHRRSRENRRIR